MKKNITSTIAAHLDTASRTIAGPITVMVPSSGTGSLSDRGTRSALKAIKGPLIGAALLALGGCAMTPLEYPQSPAEARAPNGAPGRDAATERSSNGLPGPDADAGDRDRTGSADVEQRRDAQASLALLERSRTQRAAGSYAAAASSIERALRIDPNNAGLWLELGEIRLAGGDPQQAEMMARKALSLAGPDRTVAARAGRLIERAACPSGRC